MNHAEYWILETALEARIPLCCLVYPDIEKLFNKPGHGLARGDLLELLGELFRAGDIVATPKAGTQFIPTAAQIEAEVRDRPFSERNQSVCYGLTPKGGARWEMAAHLKSGMCSASGTRPTGRHYHWRTAFVFAAWKRLSNLHANATSRDYCDK